MSDRQMLIEFLCEVIETSTKKRMDDMDILLTAVSKADYLLDNGVIVLPCKPGDTVYWLTYNRDACHDCRAYSSFYGMDAMCDYHYELWPEIIDPSNDDEHCPKHFVEIIEYKATLDFIVHHRTEFGKIIFLTSEEAEAALADMRGESE